MKKKAMIMALAFLLIGMTACEVAGIKITEEESKNPTSIQKEGSEVLNFQEITPEEAKKRLESEAGIILLDVRTPEENEEKRIPNSLLIPVDNIEKEAVTKLTDKEATLFVYCRSGRRSAIAAKALTEMGYTKVFDLGGINDWPYETESGK